MTDILLVLSMLFIAGLLFWPGFGVISRWREARRRQLRVRREDALKHILKCEVNGQVPTLGNVVGALHISDAAAAELLNGMEHSRLISHGDGRLALLPAGRELALHIVRAHRLWESYLADQTGVDEAQWHRLAERKEHSISPEQAVDLEARLGNPILDPHGDTIPVPGEDLLADLGQPLNTAQLNIPLEIVHIEDEPDAVYRQILALGLRPGMRICVFVKETECVRIWAEGRELALAPLLANNISFVSVPGATSADLFEEEYLSDLVPGEQAKVISLGASCRGPERRRLLDLGFVPGTLIEVEMISPTGDPIAYRVRGTLIALRNEQARVIRIGHRSSAADPVLPS